MPKTRTDGDATSDVDSKLDDIQNCLKVLVERLDLMDNYQKMQDQKLYTIQSELKDIIDATNRPNVNEITEPLTQTPSTAQTTNPTINLNLNDLQRLIFNYNETETPKFNGDIRNNPVQHLNHLNNIISQNMDEQMMRRIIRSSLVGEASIWYSAVEDNFSDFQSFKTLFLDKFWSQKNQTKLRENLFLARYHNEGWMSRETYFYKNYVLFKHLEPAIPERDLITYISRHFDSNIQRAVVLQNISSSQDFASLLRDFDNITEKQQPKQQFTNYRNYRDNGERDNNNSKNYDRLAQNNNSRKNFSRPNYYDKQRNNYDYKRERTRDQPRNVPTYHRYNNGHDNQREKRREFKIPQDDYAVNNTKIEKKTQEEENEQLDSFLG